MSAALKKGATTLLSGVLIWAMVTIAGIGMARALGVNADQATGASQVAMAPVVMTLTEGSSNILVLQQPPRPAGPSDGFISFDTVIIGCTAGAAAGALAIALPVLTVASSGIGLPASASAILSTAGIGCAVGVVSGLAAIGTAWGLNLINRPGESGDH